MNLYQPGMVRCLANPAHPQKQVGSLDFTARLANANRFDLVTRIAQPGGIDQNERHSADRQRYLDHVPRGPRD